MYVVLFLFGAVASSSAFLDSLLININKDCKLSEFVCRNNKCIDNSRRCNGINDCVDGSDEEDCDFVLCKSPNYFQCKDTRCISSSFVCDNEFDCDDFSDEINCDSLKSLLQHNVTCEKGMWQCVDKLCIPDEWVCNGEDDCLDGSDEKEGCSAKIECDGFKCKNGHCIPHEWRCDDHDDCHDNSDELDCENYVHPKHCTLDDRKFLCANNHTCIDSSLICDEKPDCPDKSDEGPLCRNNKASCASHNCSHECMALPTGPKCVCPKGYHTINDKLCKDINECEIYGICDQICRNTEGSYECDCEHKYILQDDKKTCKVVGGEAMMVFSSKNEIRAYFLNSEKYFPIASHLKHVVGVAYDGNNIYWTDIMAEHESIVSSKEDGSDRKPLVTSGLGLPEDLAVDWVTGNIYFTDAEKQHIGVCSNDGTHCTVLINQEIRKPRAIVLNVEDGDMYWSDWGKPAEIAYASMDGSKNRSFVYTNIFWPNGLALDYPNRRLYWTDAKKFTLESIRLDGTDRRIILDEVVKHPYAIAVFENKLYWSDWSTRSIDVCDKFTGKNKHTVIKEKNSIIYGISIFHSALRKREENPCALAFCSDICLLNGQGYTCACSEDRILSHDNHTCKDVGKKQMLIIGSKNVLIHLEHKNLGKSDVSMLPNVVKNIGALAYNSITNTLYISDLEIKKIIALNMNDGRSSPLKIDGHLGRITCMDYDFISNNLYFCDEERAVVEVLSLHSMSRRVLLHDMNGEIPESLALIPEEGVMFVALRKNFVSHIDRFHMDGTGRTHSIEHGLHGPLHLYFDRTLYRLFWSDAGTGNIETTSIDGDDRHGFRALSTSPIGITGLSKEIVWINEKSKRVYWAEKMSTSILNKKITLDIDVDDSKMHLLSVMPQKVVPNACTYNNGNCSHLCLASHKTTLCSCPIHMSLDAENNKTCINRISCDAEKQYLCSSSHHCILKSQLCDKHPDCPLGEDEDNCENNKHCPLGHFQCDNGECIKDYLACNHQFDCKDKSDENHCHERDLNRFCPPGHFKCGDGKCIEDRFVCDGVNDCNDDSDEKQSCKSMTCGPFQFRCNSGSCIPKSWECDHAFDCQDLSDEHSNCQYATCPPDMFSCTNGKCVDKKLVCDKADDCGDGSDEIACDILEYCSHEEFSCLSNTSICLPLSAKCNGTSECPHHEDEKDCSDCNLDEFVCDNKNCIQREWICDGTNDCGDNSDERKELCNNLKNSTLIPQKHGFSCENDYRCKNGACIELSKVCDGKHDCFDGSDEDGTCKSACGLGNPCSQDCLRTPMGPICKCKPGYKLLGDGHTCVDLNECDQEPPVCSQICVNQNGTYRCDCYHGFLLRSDKKWCKAEGAPLTMFYTSDNQIRQLDQQTNSLRVIYSEDSPKITGLATSVAHKYVYFSIENSGTIHRINRDTKVREYIKNVGQPQKIAIDWPTSNIYFINGETHNKYIGVCNFDGRVCSKLFDIDMHRQVSAIAIDSVNKHLFYVLTSWWVFNSPSYVIYKCNLDGSDKHELVKSSTGFITGLTVDYNKHLLYFVDQHAGQINRVNYDGKRNTLVFANLTRPKELSLFEDNLYYLLNGGYMGKCKLFDDKNCQMFKLHSYTSELFTLAQQSVQPELPNICGNHTCFYMCVASKGGFQCICPDGSPIAEQEKCYTLPRDSYNDGRRITIHKVESPSHKTKSSFGAIFTAIFVPLSVAAIGVALYFFAKKRNSGRFNVSHCRVRFINPTYNKHVDDLDKPILQPGQHEYSNPVHFTPNQAEDSLRKSLNPLLHDA